MLEQNQNIFYFDESSADTQKEPMEQQTEEGKSQQIKSPQSTTEFRYSHRKDTIQPEPAKGLQLNLIKVQRIKSDDEFEESPECQLIQSQTPQDRPRVINDNRDAIKDFKSRQKNKFEQRWESKQIIFSEENGEDHSNQYYSPPQSSMRKMWKQSEHSLSGPMSPLRLEHEENRQFSKNSNEIEEQQQYEQVKKDWTHKNEKILRDSSYVTLINKSIPVGKMVKCMVKIVKNSLLSLESVYELYLVEDRKLIMTAKKNKLNFTYQFTIYSAHKNQKSFAIAEIKSNFSRTEYVLYNNQQKQKPIVNKSDQSIVESQSLVHIKNISQSNISHSNTSQPSTRQPQTNKPNIESVSDKVEKAYISFQSNLFGFYQQAVKIILPKTKYIPPSDSFSRIKAAYQNYHLSKIQVFNTKPAQKSSDGTYRLDFKGQSLITSSKNMIIEDQRGEVCLVFGKKSQKTYMLNVMHPFSLMEGFFFALCNLDRKPFVK